MRWIGAWLGVLAAAAVFGVAHQQVGAWLEPHWSTWVEQASDSRARGALAVARARVRAWTDAQIRLAELASLHVTEADDPQAALQELVAWSEPEPSWSLTSAKGTYTSGEAPVDSTEPLAIRDDGLAVRVATEDGYLVGHFPVDAAAFRGPGLPAGVAWTWSAGDHTLVSQGEAEKGPHGVTQTVDGPVPGSQLMVSAAVSPPSLVGPLRQAILVLGGAAVGIVLLTVLSLPRASGLTAQQAMEAKVEAAVPQPAPAPAPEPPPEATRPPVPLAPVPSAPETSAGFADPALSSASAGLGGADARSMMAQAGLPSFQEPPRLQTDARQSPFHRSEQSRFDAVSYHDIQLDQGVPRRTHGPLLRTTEPEPGSEEGSLGEGSLPGETTEVSGRADQAVTEDVDPKDPALARAAAMAPPEFAVPPPPERSQTVADMPPPPTGALPESYGSTSDLRTADLQPYDEEHYRKVFNDFVAAKARLGESVAGLHFDGFRKKLETSERGLIGKHGCRTVRFMVVTRSDKVTLRPQLVR